MLRRAIAGFVGVLVGAAVVGVGVGQQAPVAKVVRAERFEMVNAKGELRAVLHATDGSAGLRLYDENGKGRASLTVAADGSPVLFLADENGMGRVAVMVLADGRPGLCLYDENEKGRASLNLARDGSPALSLDDANGKVLWSAL